MNVGQGDGVLIRLPRGGVALVDAGWDARRGVIPWLRAKDVERIDYVVMSHPHADHIGGIRTALELFDVGAVYDCGYPHTSSAYHGVLTTVRQKNIPYVRVKAGATYDWDPDVTVLALHPDVPEYSNINNNSVMLHLTYGGVSILLTGDAEAEAERAALKRFGKLIRADVLKVGHHGSATSTTRDFIAAVQPSFAFISCGLNNSFRHPRAECLETLAAAGARVFRTDLMGYLIASTDGKTVATRQAFLPFPALRLGSGLSVPFDDSEWGQNGRASGPPGSQRPVQADGDHLRLTALPGKNTWGAQMDGPYLLRPSPASDTWIVTVEMSCEPEGRETAGLMLFADTENYLTAGVDSKGELAVDLFHRGQLTPLSMKLIATVEGLGFRRLGGTLDVIALDPDTARWKRVFRYRLDEIPFEIDGCRVGPFATNRGSKPFTADFSACTVY